MSRNLGVELGPRSIRAVTSSGWPRPRFRALEVEWDPERPEPAVEALRAELGRAGRVFVAVDLALLHVKRIALPPLPPEGRRRILGVEPDRYFAARGTDLVFGFGPEDSLVFAAPEPLLASWAASLAVLGPIERIEPGPAALARGLAKAGVSDGLILRADFDAGALELYELEAGALRAARRMFGDPAQAARSLVKGRSDNAESPEVYLLPRRPGEAPDPLRLGLQDVAVKPIPDLASLDPSHLGAYGTTLQPDRWRESLLTPELERSTRRRRRLRTGVASAASLAALLFLFASIDGYRVRAERQLDSRIAVLENQAGPVLAMRSRAESLNREVQAIAGIEADRLDLLSALLEISRRLPGDAWIRNIQVTPPDWVIDGYAKDAAALIPIFEDDPSFDKVQFRAATSRAQVGNETYENFSVALRAVRAP